MKRLLVFRHAKAGPHDEKRDKQRDLIDRGRNDAALIGAAMRERGLVPTLILSSSARRTAETWKHAAPAVGGSPRVEFLDALYDASEATILKCIRAVEEDAPVLGYIGHNPGLERFARMMARKPKNPEEKRRSANMAEKFPTSAVAVLDFDVDAWAAIEGASGALCDYLTPSMLKSA
jgi:phosphohistidine phosphatase